MVTRISTLRLLYRLFIVNKRSSTTLTLDSSIIPSTSNKFTRYEANSKLVEALNYDNFDEIGSPLVLAGKTQNELVELFREQLDTEEGFFTIVKNTFRRSNLEPMEKLIENWEWREHIEENLNRMITEKPMSKECYYNVSVRLFFNNIDTKECADNLLLLLQTILCRGQRAVAITELNKIFPKIIINLYRDPFFRLLSVEYRKNVELLFKEYVKYYLDENIAKRFTIRDWWYNCAARLQLPADYFPQFEDFFKTPIQDITNLFTSFIIEHCEFPLYEGRRKRNADKLWQRAFSIAEFQIEELNPHEGIGYKTNFCKMLKIHYHLSDIYYPRHQFENLYFPSHLLPMKVPPRPWLDRGKDLEEFPEMNLNFEMMNKRIENRVQARPVFDALNDLGSTPWRINQEILGHLMRVSSMTSTTNNSFLKKLSIPRHPKSLWIFLDYDKFKDSYIKKNKYIPGETDEEKDKYIRKEFKLKQAIMTKIKNEQKSLWCWLNYRLVLAQHYVNQDIYFPHNLDFRGRCYPISPQINHMGDDLNRGLLKFSKGKPLGTDGFRWLKLHCVNITGKLKRRPISERLEYAEKNIDKIIMSAEKPFNGGNFWWEESEEPWQTLAACIEIRDAINSGDPHNFCSHLPVHQDGSCNGLQHYAALGRDLKGGVGVNLVPSDFPQDIYTTVLEHKILRVERFRKEDEQDNTSSYYEISKELREFVKGSLERKIIKQTVMTVAYGVTHYGAREQIKRQLVAIDIPDEQASRFATYLTKRTFDGLTDAFENSRNLMIWFKSCAHQILGLRQPIEWTTPLGLPVVQPYVTVEKVDDSLAFLPVPHKQMNAFPPNFVHSLDSTHMMLTSLYCRKRGITFAAIHDCYWTHACDVDEMNKICREQFIALHKQPIIQKLSQSFNSIYLTDSVREKLPEKLVDEISNAFDPSSLKLGELDINEFVEKVEKILEEKVATLGNNFKIIAA
ncbi:DNA-directed RNA polymerase [Meloidogyne graminicola]|uniref:DNA-directed RNA polymerase n=1 Tax=Meloidogyne graminicola TaxID=189291 RepID=A0A8S9ZF60_9BILA|nr:DNA-directed RNA polymerase [Meloidogyne graminicola]